MIRLTLNMPPSANKRLTQGHRLTTEAREYLENTAWDAQAQMLEQGEKMYTAPVQVIVMVYGWKGDLDNTFKLLGDSMNGVVYRDDKLINRLVIERRKGGERRVEVEITSY